MTDKRSDPDHDRHRRLRAHYAESERIADEWRERGYQYPPQTFPALPDDLRDLACGARTRAGTPCKLTAIYANGRCKLHGGLSTGPVTDEGKARAALNGNVRKRKRTP